ncbi:uncharacterized protein [Elaeis guineensis]|uniref:uncharacterized protein isoform X2 n=1 Tax=Elaeis guineensis var. tenera TaxID=51953 RepID=UPI003C6CD5F3
MYRAADSHLKALKLKKIKAELGEASNNPQGLLLEAIHSAGCSGALPNPLIAPESAINRLNGTILQEFVGVRSSTGLVIVCYSFVAVVSIDCFQDNHTASRWYFWHLVWNMRNWYQLLNHYCPTFPKCRILKSQNLCMLEETIDAKRIHRHMLPLHLRFLVDGIKTRKP